MNNHKVLALPDFGGGRVRKYIKDYPEVYDTSITKSYIQIRKIILFGWKILQNDRLRTWKIMVLIIVHIMMNSNLTRREDLSQRNNPLLDGTSNDLISTLYNNQRYWYQNSRQQAFSEQTNFGIWIYHVPHAIAVIISLNL